MAHAVELTDDRTQLRQLAMTQLAFSARREPQPSGMSEALTVLHRLASSPATAGDALALLHELQVHQVELELQQEELGSSRAELETALIRQTALVDRSPAGLMTVDARTVLCEVNPAGARLLGASPEELLGRPLASLLSVASASALHAQLARSLDGQVPETCRLQLLPLSGRPETVYASAGNDTVPGRFLLVLLAADVTGT